MKGKWTWGWAEQGQGNPWGSGVGNLGLETQRRAEEERHEWWKQDARERLEREKRRREVEEGQVVEVKIRVESNGCHLAATEQFLLAR